MTTHYDTLGVAADATGGEIRDAYRRLARRHHPDRGGRDAGTMAALNEAYRVLGDPARRAVYDAGLRPGVVTPAPRRPAPPPGRGAPVRPPVDSTPARYPWKLVAVMFTLGATVVLLGAALYEPAGEPVPDNLLQPGSCVAIEANGDAREIPCAGEAALVVVEVVPADGRCPEATAAHRDTLGRGLACIREEPTTG